MNNAIWLKVFFLSYALLLRNFTVAMQLSYGSYEVIGCRVCYLWGYSSRSCILYARQLTLLNCNEVCLVNKEKIIWFICQLSHTI